MKRLLLGIIFLTPTLIGTAGHAANDPWGREGVVAVRWQDGSLRKSFGPLSGPASASPVEVARRFVDSHRMSILGRDGFDLIQTSSSGGPSGTRVEFEIAYSNIPVYGGQVSVHVLRDGRIDLVEATPLSGLPATSTPRIGMAAASQAARRILEARYGSAAVPVAPGLVYHEVAGQLHLCWRVQLPSPAGAWEFLVSAEEPGITYAMKRMALDEKTGKGSVYLENPKITKQPQNVNLAHLDNSFTLKGSWARTYNANKQSDFTDSSQMGRYTTASSTNDNYVYSTKDKRFTEVMGYYHVTRMHDYLKDNKLTTAVNGQMPVVVNVQDNEDPTKGYDNAFFTRDYRFSSTGILVFGSGEELHNLAEDSDVIYHEYGHAVLDKIQRGLIQHYEHVFSGAIHEGTGDAVAAHLNGNSKLAEWALSYRGTGEFVGRNVDNTNRYPDDVQDPEFGQAESHHTGLIVGGLFWQIREALGADTAIKLYFDALNRLGPRANFFDLRDDLLLAEKALEGNTNLVTLTGILTARGLDGVDPGNKEATATLQKLQTRHFDWDTFEAGGLAESFTPGTWIALTATLNVKNASPGYYTIPALKIIFPADVGYGGYEAYYVVNEEQPDVEEYVVGLIYSPDYAVPATLTWKVKCRLGDQTKYTAEKKDTFKIQ